MKAGYDILLKGRIIATRENGEFCVEFKSPNPSFIGGTVQVWLDAHSISKQSKRSRVAKCGDVMKFTGILR